MIKIKIYCRTKHFAANIWYPSVYKRFLHYRNRTKYSMCYINIILFNTDSSERLARTSFPSGSRNYISTFAFRRNKCHFWTMRKTILPLIHVLLISLIISHFSESQKLPLRHLYLHSRPRYLRALPGVSTGQWRNSETENGWNDPFDKWKGSKTRKWIWKERWWVGRTNETESSCCV